MPWDPNKDNQSTWTPPTAEQIDEMRRNYREPRLEIVQHTPEKGPARQHREINGSIGGGTPTTIIRQDRSKKPVLH